MKPGRELDALVAEKVLGLKVFRDDHSRGGWSLGPPDYYDNQGCTELYNPLPEYSEDIAAAWKVVEKLGLSLVRLPSGKWWAGFLPLSSGLFGYVYDTRLEDPLGDTAPHAICLAALTALKAVGEKA